MSYNPNIPASGTRIDQTYQLITTNFSQANTIFGSDHVEFNNGTSSNRGKHKKSTYLEQVAAPTTAANEGAVYTKVGTNPAETNLFYRAESDGKEYQLTTVKQANASKFGVNSNYTISMLNYVGGWTFLAGNLILQWGKLASETSDNTIECRFPYSFSTILNVWFSQTDSATVNNPDSLYILSGTIDTSGFNIRNATKNHSNNVNFFGIGIGFS